MGTIFELLGLVLTYPQAFIRRLDVVNRGFRYANAGFKLMNLTIQQWVQYGAGAESVTKNYARPRASQSPVHGGCISLEEKAVL